MKIRHLLIALAALLTIAFMPPLVSFLGGLTLVLGAGTLIFRDLSPASQEAAERHILGWLRRVRTGGSASASEFTPTTRSLRSLPGKPVERARRIRAKAPTAGRMDLAHPSSPENDDDGRPH